MKFAKGTFRGMTDGEISSLRKAVRSHGGMGVEIGCCDGFSTAHVLDGSDLYLVCVDPFIPDSMENQILGDPGRFMKNVEKWKGRVRLVMWRSSKMAAHWFGPIDFLLIDGDHRKRAVQNDFLNWTPWLREGGLLAMHDARVYRGGPRHWPGPSEVAEEWVYDQTNRWKVVEDTESLMVATKL